MNRKKRLLLCGAALLLLGIAASLALYHPPVKNPLPVLMYHHLTLDAQDCNDMTITADRMDKDLQWLSDHGYTPVLPRELIAGDPLPEKPILITFDDGYTSNYELLFPLLKKHQAKAAIALIAGMQDNKWADQFMRWEQCREMAGSSLVEFGSHTYLLHNMDERNGSFTRGGINGIQRKPEESDEAFEQRVLEDIRLSVERISTELGHPVEFFAYPYGLVEPDAEPLIEELFPLTLITLKGTNSLDDGLRHLHRYTVTMDTPLSRFLD